MYRNNRQIIAIGTLTDKSLVTIESLIDKKHQMTDNLLNNIQHLG
jgi:hypothetical protein